MITGVEHEKCFITSEPELSCESMVHLFNTFLLFIIKIKDFKKW